MFNLYADKNKLTMHQRELVTSGSVNAYRVHITFSADWDGLTRTAIFRAGMESQTVLLGEDNEAVIPWEVLTEPGRYLMVGVCGRRGGDMVLPTVWVNLGMVMAGVPAAEPVRPTPELWEQALAQKGDRLGYTDDGDLGLYAGDKLLSAVPIEGGTTDHRQLSHRDAEEQHPIEAISGLAKELERIPEPVEALTNFELEEILK